jgi:hypothetical protein
MVLGLPINNLLIISGFARDVLAVPVAYGSLLGGFTGKLFAFKT